VGQIFSIVGCIFVAVPFLSGRHGGGSKVEGLASFLLAQRASCRSYSPAAFKRRVFSWIIPCFAQKEPNSLEKILSTTIRPKMFDLSIKLVFCFTFIDFKEVQSLIF
jgi:hypothetical protein